MLCSYESMVIAKDTMKDTGLNTEALGGTNKTNKCLPPFVYHLSHNQPIPFILYGYYIYQLLA